MAKGKKTGGRTKGTPNKNTVEIREAARAFLDDVQGQAALLAQFREGKLPPQVLAMFYYYAHGKPRETLMVEGEMRPLVIDRVSTRAEMLEALGEPDPDAGDED